MCRISYLGTVGVGLSRHMHTRHYSHRLALIVRPKADSEGLLACKHWWDGERGRQSISRISALLRVCVCGCRSSGCCGCCSCLWLQLGICGYRSQLFVAAVVVCGGCSCLWLLQLFVAAVGCLWLRVGVCGCCRCLWLQVGVCGCRQIFVGVCGCRCVSAASGGCLWLLQLFVAASGYL